MEMISRKISKERYILLLALAYSILIFSLSPINLPIEDSAIFSSIGRNLITGGGFTSNGELQWQRAPLYPAMIAVYMLLFGDLFMKFLPATIAFFLILAGFFFTLDLTRKREVSYLSAFFLASLPLVLYNSMRILSDVPFLLFTILAFWTYVRFMERGGRNNLILWSAFTSLAVLTRFTGFVLIPIFGVHYIISKTRKPKAVGMKGLLAFLIITGLILSPWVIWRASGGTFNEAWVIETRLSRTYEGVVNVDILALEDGKSMHGNDISFHASVPVQLVTVIRILAISLIYITPLVSLAFVYLLYSFLKTRRMKEHHILLLVWILGFIIFHSLLPWSMDSRYLLPITLPMVIIFSEYLSGIDSRKLFSLLLVLQLLMSLSIIIVDSQVRWQRIQTGVFYESGRWIRDNTPTNSTVLSLGSTALAYYSERHVVNINETADYVVESNYVSSPSIEEYINQTGTGYSLLKEFSDSLYYARIYGRSNFILIGRKMIP